MRAIALDIETTGLNPLEGHKIIEIGCVELLNNFPPFFTLQDEQAVTTLSQSVFPPLDLGKRWSNVNSFLLPQY